MYRVSAPIKVLDSLAQPIGVFLAFPMPLLLGISGPFGWRKQRIWEFWLLLLEVGVLVEVNSLSLERWWSILLLLLEWLLQLLSHLIV